MKYIYTLLLIGLSNFCFCQIGIWTTQTIDAPRQLMGAASTDSLFFFAGGNEPGFTPSGKVEIYVVEDDVWLDDTLTNNSGSGNLFVDMELAGVTNNLFGIETPVSENNTINTGGQNISIIDCGLNNVVHGGSAFTGPCSE